MALARIISSSRECARELAVNLLDRGYAVEIVSPEAIPIDVADLELRVESNIPEFLTGSVKAHDGVRSASLEFIHHLKTPTPDFKRRPPGSGAPPTFKTELEPFPAVPDVDSVEQSAVEKVEIPLSPGNARGAVPSPTAAVAASAKLDAVEKVEVPLSPEKVPSPLAPLVSNAEQNLIEKVEGARSAANASGPSPAMVEVPKAPAEVICAITPPEQPPTAPKEANEPTEFAVKIIIPKSKGGKRIRRRGWFGRAALASAAVVLTALALGSGTTWFRNTASISDSGGSGIAAAVENQRPAIAAGPIAPVPGSPASAPARPTVAASGKQEAEPAAVPKNAVPPPSVKATTARFHQSRSRRHIDDVIAPDTVTYFDQGAKPVRVEQFIPHPATPAKHDGAVAASKTGVNDRTVP